MFCNYSELMESKNLTLFHPKFSTHIGEFILSLTTPQNKHRLYTASPCVASLIFSRDALSMLSVQFGFYLPGIILIDLHTCEKVFPNPAKQTNAAFHVYIFSSSFQCSSRPCWVDWICIFKQRFMYISGVKICTCDLLITAISILTCLISSDHFRKNSWPVPGRIIV